VKREITGTSCWKMRLYIIVNIMERFPLINTVRQANNMKIYREVYIKSKFLSEAQLFEMIKQFCINNEYWDFLVEKSEQYSESMNEPACMISTVPQKDLGYAAVAIAKKKDNVLYIPNIIPRGKGRLSRNEYNTIAYRFISDFRKFVRKNKLQINTSSNDKIGIKDIITSSKARSFLNQYLNAFPKSYHYLDIERLDKFTCALARYSRKNPNFEYFERYLIEELSWSEKDAAWCSNRVELGYTVLGVNRVFF